MKYQPLLHIICLVVWCFHSWPALSQDNNQPKHFFKGNYAKSPLNEATEQAPSKSLQEGVEPDTAKQSHKSESGNLLSTPVDESPETSSILSKAIDDSYEIQKIGAVLNSIDGTHYKQNVDYLIEMLVKYNLDSGTIYAVGGLTNLVSLQSENQAIVARGGTIRLVDSVPVQYQSTTSPTWIISTEKGEVVVEGVENLGKLISAKGRLVLPNQSDN